MLTVVFRHILNFSYTHWLIQCFYKLAFPPYVHSPSSSFTHTLKSGYSIIFILFLISFLFSLSILSILFLCLLVFTKMVTGSRSAAFEALLKDTHPLSPLRRIIVATRHLISLSLWYTLPHSYEYILIILTQFIPISLSCIQLIPCLCCYDPSDIFQTDVSVHRKQRTRTCPLRTGLVYVGKYI